MTDVLLKIGELAARAQVSPRTVDYYTGLGLLNPAKRTAGNYRLYHPTDVERIHLVQRLEVQGVPLEEIATALRDRHADVAVILDRIDADLRTLQAAAEAASPEVHGLLAAIATRVHSLITVALQIPPDLPLP
ncbi:DNA-binding transcriptional MerR regulator [Saccharothrix tamanrassetensis]|uniref:DNA-binding transcriptional MerR regulator n=1 Tax=Saccharothrix tamanrassetensis TaxID=1051531 RepID=A0A841CQI0_9PSEU|nr:MerR family transcriptional regulator [Saccharothrix tamanrassetensis]MBB5959549.1 DNA-binding transcriptional MerR regulator [Saccharothrix tamanrassetensis]